MAQNVLNPKMFNISATVSFVIFYACVMTILLEVKLPYDPAFPPVCWLTCRLVGRSVSRLVCLSSARELLSKTTTFCFASFRSRNP